MPRLPSRCWAAVFQTSLPGARVERVDVVVVGAEVDAAAGVGDRVLDLVAGLERPAGRARGRAERVDLAVPVADVDDPVEHERRGLGRPDLQAPAQLAGVGVERHHLAVEPGAGRVAGRLVQEGHVDGVVVDRRRGGRAAVGAVGPAHLHGLGHEREEHALRVGEVEAAVRDRRRELEQRAGPEEPERLVRRLDEHLLRVALARRVEAVHRPADLRRRRRRLRRGLRGDELLGRGAADVVALVLAVEAERDQAGGDQEHDARRAEQDLLHRARFFGAIA